MPAGPGGGCRPRRSGRRRPATTRSSGRSRRYPWGDADPTPAHANLGQRHLRPAPAGAYPEGQSPLGIRQLIGDVWEWTSSDFLPYPGFVAFPYREYSEVFFGPGHKVLRGGAFSVDEVACRGTFRNWDLPVRRQIFAGFRTARDATDVPSHRLSGPPLAAGRASRAAAARAVPAVVGAAPAAARHGQRRRFRCRLVRATAIRCPPATGAPGRSGPTRTSRTWPGWCAPERCSRRSGTPPRRARTARRRPRLSPPGAGCSATTAPCGTGRTARRRSPPRCPPRRCSA